MAKKPNLSSAKKKAWTEFSRFVRLRDCLKTTGTKEDGICVTCGRRYPFKSLQAGHFIPGRNNAVLFDERGVNAQCTGCNMFKGGAVHAYWLWMEKTYGREVIDEMLLHSNTTVKYRVTDYEELARDFKARADAL